jgi:phosphatidyl-myo-inositol alpha-mannosyltransferase
MGSSRPNPRGLWRPASPTLRVGMFCASWPVPKRKPGGVDVSVRRLAKALADRGHQVRIFSFAARVTQDPYDHVKLRPVGIQNRKLLGRYLLIPLLLNRLDTTDLDVLHIHGDDWLFMRRSVPTIRTFHGSALFEALHATNPLRRMSQLVSFATELVSARLAIDSYTVSPGEMPIYRAAGYLPHGLKPGAEMVDDRKSPRPSILFVGTWDGRKRGELLARVFAREIRPHLHEAELWMVSDRYEPGDGIRWFGSPGDEELAELYRRAWVFCLPSTYEGFGLPYLEAMARGTAVVASPNPGAIHLLDDGKAGWIVDDRDLHKALIRLLTDDGMRESVAARGATRAKDFSWDRVVISYERAYSRAIEAWRLQRSRSRADDPPGSPESPLA